MAPISVHSLIPAFLVNQLRTEFGETFSNAIREARTLPNGTLVVENIDNDDHEFNSFYRTNKLGLRFATPVFRSLAPFELQFFSVLIPMSYNNSLGDIHFGIGPAAASPHDDSERLLEFLPIRLHFLNAVSQSFGRSLCEFVPDWISRNTTFSAHDVIAIVSKPKLSGKKMVEFAIDASEAQLFDLVGIVAAAVEFAVLHHDNPMRRISIVHD